MWGDQIRFYVMTGPNLPDLRKDYMELLGSLRDGLRQHNFPLDGFVLDLQSFGGVTAHSPDIRALTQDDIGLVTIEESYVSRNTTS